MICRVFSVPLIQLRLFCSTVLYQWMLALYLPLSWLPRPCTGMLAVWVQGLLYLLASLLYCLGPGRWQKVGCQCVLLRRNEDMTEYWVVSAIGRGLPKVIAVVIVSLSKYVSCAFWFSQWVVWSHGPDSVTQVLLTFFLSWLSFSFI